MRIKIAVVFGGESVEHEISIISAHQALAAFDLTKYDPFPVYISKDNRWYVGNILNDIDNFKDLDFVIKNATEVKLITEGSRYFFYKYPLTSFFPKPMHEFDVAFPIVHGTNVEDGTLQGFFDNMRIPYVGPNLNAAVVGQDKVFMKMIWQASDLPILPYVWFFKEQWKKSQDYYLEKLEQSIDYPMIIKPASLGSSVGISVAKDRDTLVEAIHEAIQYDEKIIVEKALTKFTELNCSVIGMYTKVQASVIEQVFPESDILTYQDKYQGGNTKKHGNSGELSHQKMSGMVSAHREVPAQIDEETTKKIQKIAELSFMTLGMSGVSRIDFLFDNEANEIFLNEINTIPGSLSFYLWEASGKKFAILLNELIQLAVERQHLRDKKIFSYTTNVLSQTSNQSIKGTKGIKR